jgi:hypothetical protein
MMDTEIKLRGFELLSQNMGLVDAERFICLIQRERFDYTKWRQTLFEGASGEEISRRAMAFRRSTKPVKQGAEQE